MGYKPNSLARSLRTRETRTIGFISDEVTTTPFAVSMLAAAQDEAARHGYLLFVLNLGKNATLQTQSEALELLMDHQVSGLIHACMYHRTIEPLPGLPEDTVFLNASALGGTHRSIVPDEFQGGYDAARELLEAGHRRIAYVGDALGAPASEIRLRGYLAALRDAGVDPDPRLQMSALPAVEGGLRVADLLDLPADLRPTGIFCFNDRMAMGAYRAIRKRGRHVPDDVSIVGFDDQEFIASELDPPLTTMRLPHREMGLLAVRQLLGLPEAEQAPPAVDNVTRLRCELVRRESVGRV
jgi:LacI family transcriptional regulator